MLSQTCLTAQVLLFCLAYTVTGIDWCKVICPKTPAEPHTMCKYQQGGVDSCKTWTQGLTAEEKQIVMDYHNMLRDKIASGKETRGIGGVQPKAADMMELVWDNEAEEIAQRWTDQCQEPDGHDKCRIASDGTYTGQNFASRGWLGERKERKKVIEQLVQDWYDEIDLYYTSDVDNFFERSKSSDVGHFTQLAWAKTTRVGCGFAYYQEGEVGDSSFRMFCNYKEGGNFRTKSRTPMYNRAVTNAGESCTAGTSAKYPNLCKPLVRGDVLRDSVRERKEVPELSPRSRQAEEFRVYKEQQSSNQLPGGFHLQAGQPGQTISFSSSQDMTPEQLRQQFPQLQGLSQGSGGPAVVKVFRTTPDGPLTQGQISEMMVSPHSMPKFDAGPSQLGWPKPQFGTGVRQPLRVTSQFGTAPGQPLTSAGQPGKPPAQLGTAADQPLTSAGQPDKPPAQLGYAADQPVTSPTQPGPTPVQPNSASPPKKRVSILWKIMCLPKVFFTWLIMLLFR